MSSKLSMREDSKHPSADPTSDPSRRHSNKSDHSPIQTELAQIDMILRSGDEIHKLAVLGLVSRLVEDVEEVSVVRFLSEMFLYTIKGVSQSMRFGR